MSCFVTPLGVDLNMRKIIASLILVTYLAGYILIVATIGSWTASWHGAAQIAYFAVAGTIWIIPLKWLFAWMNTPQSD